MTPPDDGEKWRTPLTAKYLTDLAAVLGWTQQQMATLTEIDQSTVARNLNAERPVREKHLAAYLGAVPSGERARLLGAWLRDTLPETLHADLFNNEAAAEGRLREDTCRWAPALSDEDRSRLEWLATQLPIDHQLQTWFRIITGRLGYGTPS